MNFNYNVSSLFSSLNNSTSGTSGLGSLLSDYSSIRNGSYGKLMKAYYNNVDNGAVKSTYNNAVKNSNTSTAADSSAVIKELQSTTDDLTASARDLYTSGSKSVFQKKSIADENGNTTQQYDTDAIYKSVKGFVDDYNSVLEAADKSADSKVQNSVTGMINYTKMETNMLGKLGFSIKSIFADDCFFELSNEISLGITEESTINNLNGIIEQISKQERELRQELMAENDLEDKIFRAIGTLKMARQLSAKELFSLVSLARLGIALSLFDNNENIDFSTLDSMLFTLGTATIMSSTKEGLTQEEANKLRANYIRERIG